MLTSEAIVLKSIDFRDHQKVVTLFTPQHGILSMFASHLSPKNLHKVTLCSPLTRGTYILSKGNKDLYKMKDASLIDGHFELRNAMKTLKAGLEMVKLIDHSQMPHKAAPALYQLLRSYLKALKSFPHTDALLTSFCLKLLIHEGVFQEDDLSTPLTQLAFIKTFDEIEAIEIESDDHEHALTLAQSIVK